MSGFPCRISADLRADQLREDRAPDEICDHCGAKLFINPMFPNWTPQHENWLVCPCGNALCEDCCIAIREAEDATGFQHWLGWETVHNDGFCSPGCILAELEKKKREVRWLEMEGQ